MSKEHSESKLKVVLITAEHWMEADSIKNYLINMGIDVHVPNRTSSGSLAGEVDLRLGGYSAVSTGFEVFVDEEQLDQAKKELVKWRKETRSHEEKIIKDANYYLIRFSRAALFSLFLPVFLHIVGLYLLVKYLQHSGKISRIKFLFSFLVLVATGVGFGLILYYQ